MAADIIPINTRVAGEASSLSRDIDEPPPRDETDAEFFAKVWRGAIERGRERRIKTEAEWGRIGSLILDSCHTFEERHDEPAAWPLDEGLHSFVKAAMTYYLRHAKRFSVDKNGRPKSTCVARKGR